jgi:hypothetical protein
MGTCKTCGGSGVKLGAYPIGKTGIGVGKIACPDCSVEEGADLRDPPTENTDDAGRPVFIGNPTSDGKPVVSNEPPPDKPVQQTEVRCYFSECKERPYIAYCREHMGSTGRAVAKREAYRECRDWIDEAQGSDDPEKAMYYLKRRLAGEES